MPLAALRGAVRPALGTGTRSIEDVRGLPCSIGLKVPDPLSESPSLPCVKVVACWPGITCAIWPDLKSATSTWPRITSTLVLAGVHGDAKLRALDHGGEIGGLDLEMLDVALFDLEQDRTGLLHDRRRQPVLLLAGTPTTEFGEISMVSSPRRSSTRPLRPVRMVSPGFSSLFLLQRRRLRAGTGEPDFAGGFADRPGAVIGGKSAGSCRQNQRCRQKPRNAMQLTA